MKLLQKPGWAFTFYVLALLVCASPLRAQSYQLHSVFMYSFTRYVQWPDDKNAGDFRILVVGESPIIEELRKMAETKKVGSRSIKVEEAAKITGNEGSHIIFISAGKSALLPEVLAKVNGVLVVTEKEGLGSKGSAINFFVKEGKLAFELNQNALNKQGLKASTELIRLAVVI